MDPFTIMAIVQVAISVVDNVVMAIYKGALGPHQKAKINEFKKQIQQDANTRDRVLSIAARRDAQAMANMMNSVVGGLFWDSANLERQLSQKLSEAAERALSKNITDNTSNLEKHQDTSIDNATSSIDAAIKTAGWNKLDHTVSKADSQTKGNVYVIDTPLDGPKQVTHEQLTNWVLDKHPEVIKPQGSKSSNESKPTGFTADTPAIIK